MAVDYIDRKRARELVHDAVGMVKDRMWPFNKNLNTLFPDAAVPPEIEPGSKEHALYQFHSVSIDSRLQAKQVYQGMHALMEILDSPSDLARLHEIPEEKLEAALRPIFGPQSRKQDPMNVLIYNSGKLAREYRGDACLLYPDFMKRRQRTTEAVVRKTLDNVRYGERRKVKFRQYGTSKPALFVKNMVRSGIWPFEEHNIPIKVDRHVCRIALGTGIVDFEQFLTKPDWNADKPKHLRRAKEQLIRMGTYTEEEFDNGEVEVVRFTPRMIQDLTDTFWSITKRDKISAVDLDDALWAVGAYLCKKNSAIACKIECRLGCTERFPSDNNAVWYFVGRDKRKDGWNLFNWQERANSGT